MLSAGIDTCVHRMRHFAPYCDIMWAETAKPILADAVKLAKGVEGVYGPGEQPYLAYNLSPSFNWDASGMTDAQVLPRAPASPPRPHVSLRLALKARTHGQRVGA